MTTLVPAIDPTTIATIIEANINAYLLSFACLPGAILHHDEHSVWIDSGRPDATLNAVLTMHFAPHTVDAQVEAILSHFRAQSRPVTWHLGPSREPADLGSTLLNQGLTHSEDEPGMAIEIDSLQADFAALPGLTIETVHDQRGLEEWVAVWLFPVPESIRNAACDALRQRGLSDKLPWRYFVGRINGRPVACSQLFCGAGVAAVHYVVTLPEARRRGIGTAMTVHVLREARAMGYRVGVLTASPEGIGVYRRIGFREYCWFRRYEWAPIDGGGAS